MNDFGEIFKSAAECIATNRNIVSEAADRAAQSRISGKYTRRLRPAVCILAAAVMLCGMSVSAVKYGWLNMVFGNSGDVISENYDRYALEITEPEIDNRLPDCEITVNEVISDGEAMYIDLLIENPHGNENDRYNIYPSLDDNFGGGLYTPGVIASGEDFLEMYLSFSSNEGISMGDRLVLKGYRVGKDAYMDADDYDFRISFTVAQEPEDMSVTLTPGREITFASGGRNGTTVAYIESIRISPLSYQIKGEIISTTIHRSDALHAVMDMDIPVFVLTDGTRLPMSDLCNGCGGQGGGDYFTVETIFTRVLPIDDLAGIEYGDSFIEVDR